jgi:putative ABC transport system substrate-binding protein
MVTAGGLVSYGSDLDDQSRRAAGYVDRILKGEKPADLPVQAPTTRYELVINLKTAKAPGSNLTGLFLDAPTLCGKWLQQIGDIIPNVSKVAALWDATTGTYQLDAIKAAVKARSIDLVVMEFRDKDGLEVALNSGLAQGPQAVIQLGSPLTRQAGTRTAEILSARRIPGISQFRTFPDGGGLMSYGPDLIQLYRRTGAFVSKILHGAHPADLPIERPTKFELVINMKTAKELGIEVPISMQMLADEVIE